MAVRTTDLRDLDNDDFDAIATHRDRPSVSIFLPTHQTGRETQQDPIRLSNLVRRAHDGLTSLGLHHARWLDESLDSFTHTSDFWRRQGPGLAVFASPAAVAAYRLTAAPEEQVYVSDRFQIRPLLASLQSTTAAVLALSLGDVRLFRSHGGRLHRAEYDGPESMEDVNWFLDRTDQLQSHPTTSGGIAQAFHGHDPSGYEDADRDRFVRAVSGSLPVDETDALVVVATERVAAHFRTVHDGPIAAVVEGSPHGIDVPALESLVGPALEKLAATRRDQRVEAMRSALGTGSALTALDQVLQAAIAGRIARLLVTSDAPPVWGVYDVASLEIEQHDEYQPWDVDLMDAAIREAAVTGADLGVVDELVDDAVIGAQLRY